MGQVRGHGAAVEHWGCTSSGTSPIALYMDRLCQPPSFVWSLPRCTYGPAAGYPGRRIPCRGSSSASDKPQPASLSPPHTRLSLTLSPLGCGLDAGEPHDGREPLLLDVSIAGNRSLHQTTLHEHATLGPPCPWRQHHALLVLTRAPPLTMFLAGTHRATPPPTRWCCGSPVGPAAAP